MRALSDLITDWGGFEQLVGDLHATGAEVAVERNVKLPSKEGGTYQIDVLVRSRQGMYEYLTIIECKWWDHRVGRNQITHLKHVRECVGADKAVCFSRLGFESGAEEVARANGIGLYVVREMRDEEWGKPGKTATLYLQFFQAAMAPSFPKALVTELPGSDATPGVALRVQLAPKDVALRKADGTPAGTLLDILHKLRHHAYQQAFATPRLWNGGAEGTFYIEVICDDVRFEGGSRHLTLDGRRAVIHSMACNILFRVRQSPLVLDRSKNFDYALVVEDFVRGHRFAADRRADGSETKVYALLPPEPADKVVENGSIIAILIKDYLDYETTKQASIATRNPP